MEYVKDIIQPLIKQYQRDTIIDDSTLKMSLWNTTSTQAYLTRSDEFDASWLSKSSSNLYVALKLKKAFDASCVNSCKIEDLDKKVRFLESEKQQENFLFIGNNNPLFEEFWGKIRNSLAHGTFGMCNGRYYMLGQFKAKPDAKVNFLLQTTADLNNVLQNLWYDFKKSLNDVVGFKYECLTEALDLQQVQGRYYSEKEKRFVVINDDFKFLTDKHKEEIQNLLSQYKANEKIDIISNEKNIASFKKDNLISKNGLVRLVPQSKLKEYYEIPEIMV